MATVCRHINNTIHYLSAGVADEGNGRCCGSGDGVFLRGGSGQRSRNGEEIESAIGLAASEVELEKVVGDRSQSRFGEDRDRIAFLCQRIGDDLDGRE